MSNFVTAIKGIFSGGSLVKDLGDVVDKFVTTKEEKAEAQRLMQKAIHDFEMKQKEHALEVERVYLEDVQSARQMQMEALRQNDRFSKRYVYFLASFMVLGAFAFGMALMWLEIPQDNKRMVEMFADIFLFAGAVTVINFFFGSSKGSSDKTALMAEGKAGNKE